MTNEEVQFPERVIIEKDRVIILEDFSKINILGSSIYYKTEDKPLFEVKYIEKRGILELYPWIGLPPLRFAKIIPRIQKVENLGDRLLLTLQNQNQIEVQCPILSQVILACLDSENYAEIEEKIAKFLETTEIGIYSNGFTLCAWLVSFLIGFNLFDIDYNIF